MSSKITWQDLHNATFADLKKTYKLSDRQLEQGVRKHLDGATAQERSSLYEKVWTPEKKR